MSHFYTTKSLGRTWLPSSVRGGMRPRYGDWPAKPPKLRWLPDDSNATMKRCWIWRWSKVHERLCFAIVLILLVGWVGLCRNSILPQHMEVSFPRKSYPGTYFGKAWQHFVPGITPEIATSDELNLSPSLRISITSCGFARTCRTYATVSGMS